MRVVVGVFRVSAPSLRRREPVPPEFCSSYEDGGSLASGLHNRAPKSRSPLVPPPSSRPRGYVEPEVEQVVPVLCPFRSLAYGPT